MTGTVSKPPAREYGEPKRRRCLKCQKRFPSRWPGERVCGGCRSSKEWRSSAAAAFVAQEAR